ncbi:unnamed protein product [Amoebophrya sp. A25]|nr:unnamed protein product [Amoebophrya sp. A25]|eukprot:GSA25T00009575001.1
MPSRMYNPALVKDEANPNSTSMKDAYRTGQKTAVHSLDEFLNLHGGMEAFADQYESVTVINQTTYDHYFNDPHWKAMLKVQNTPMEGVGEKLPTDGYAVKDNTFDRCYGHRTFDIEFPASVESGRFFREGNRDLKAGQNFRSKGPRQMIHEAAAADHADKYVAAVEQIEEARCVFPFPVTTNQELNQRTEATKPPAGPLRTRTDVRTQTSYSKDVPITFYTEQLKSDSSFVRSSVNVSAATGHHLFGKNAKFSAPTNLSYTEHPHKTEADNEMFQQSEARRLETQKAGESVPSEGELDAVTNLAHLKIALVTGLREKEGPLCLAKLRQAMKDACDKDGFLPKALACKILATSGVDEKAIGFLVERMQVNSDVAMHPLLQAVRPPIRQGGERALWLSEVLAAGSERWTEACGSAACEKFGLTDKDAGETFLNDVAAVCFDVAEIQAAVQAA